MGLPLDSFARWTNMISTGAALPKPVTPQLLDEHDKENSSNNSMRTPRPSLDNMDVDVDVVMELGTDVDRSRPNTHTQAALAHGGLKREPETKPVTKPVSSLVPGIGTSVGTTSVGSNASDTSATSTGTNTSTPSNTATNTNSINTDTLVVEAGKNKHVASFSSPSSNSLGKSQVPLAITASAITPPKETLLNMPSPVNHTPGSPGSVSSSAVVPATTTITTAPVSRSNNNANANEEEEISTSTTSNPSTYQPNAPTNRISGEKIQVGRPSSDLPEQTALATQQQGSVDIARSTGTPGPGSGLSTTPTNSVDKATTNTETNSNANTNTSTTITPPRKEAANQTHPQNINSVISPELEPPKGIFRTRAFPSARPSPGQAPNYTRGTSLPGTQPVYGAGSPSRQRPPTISSYRFPPLPPNSSGQTSSSSSSSSSSSASVTLMSEHDPHHHHHNQQPQSQQHHHHHHLQHGPGPEVLSPAPSTTTSPTSPIRHHSDDLGVRSALGQRTHQLQPHHSGSSSISEQVPGTSTGSGAVAGATEMHKHDKAEGHNEPASASGGDPILSSLLGAPLSQWKYSDESLIQALQLKSEQERTKQEFYRLETRKKSLKLLSECIRSNIPPASIPFIFQAPDDPAVAAALSAAQGLEVPPPPAAAPSHPRQDFYASHSRSPTLKSVQLPPSSVQPLPPHMASTGHGLNINRGLSPRDKAAGLSPGITMIERDRYPATMSGPGHQRNMSLPVQHLPASIPSKKQPQQQAPPGQRQQAQAPPQQMPPTSMSQSPVKRPGHHQHHASTSALPSYSSPMRGPGGLYGPGGSSWQAGQRPYYPGEASGPHQQQQQRTMSPSSTMSTMQHPPPQQPQSISPSSASRLQHIIQFHHWQPITTRPPTMSSGSASSSSGSAGQVVDEPHTQPTKRRKSATDDTEESSPPSVAAAAAIASTTGAQVTSGSSMTTASASALAHSRRRTMGHARHRSEAAISYHHNWSSSSVNLVGGGRVSPKSVNENKNVDKTTGSSMLETLAATASAESDAQKQQSPENDDEPKTKVARISEEPNESGDKSDKHDVKFMMSNS